MLCREGKCVNVANKKCRGCGEFFCMFHIVNHAESGDPHTNWLCNICGEEGREIRINTENV